VFTTHTPEEAGNEKHDIYLCHKMSYFCGLTVDEVKKLCGLTDDRFNHSLAALRFARLANGVSQLHGVVSREMWKNYEDVCPIISITNSQNWRYWADKQMYRFMEEGNDWGFDDRKKHFEKKSL
jgi:starch phosphorylase